MSGTFPQRTADEYSAVTPTATATSAQFSWSAVLELGPWWINRGPWIVTNTSQNFQPDNWVLSFKGDISWKIHFSNVFCTHIWVSRVASVLLDKQAFVGLLTYICKLTTRHRLLSYWLDNVIFCVLLFYRSLIFLSFSSGSFLHCSFPASVQLKDSMTNFASTCILIGWVLIVTVEFTLCSLVQLLWLFPAMC